jgi:chromosome segregation ATPase
MNKEVNVMPEIKVNEPTDEEAVELGYYMSSVVALGQTAYTDKVLEQYEISTMKLIRTERELGELKAELPTLNAVKNQLIKQLNELRLENSTLREELDKRNLQLEEAEGLATVRQSEIVSLQREVHVIADQNTELDEKVAVLKRDVERLSHENQHLAEEELRTRNQYAAMRRERDALHESVEDCHARIEAQHERNLELEAQLGSKERALAVASDVLVKIQSEIVTQSHDLSNANGTNQSLLGIIYNYRQSHASICQCEACEIANEYDIVHDDVKKMELPD